MIRYQLGIDESGTGAWAGPFCVCGVLLPLGEKLEGVTDSKKLSDKKRRQLYTLIDNKVVYWQVEVVSPEMIRQRGQGPAWQDALVKIVKNTLAVLGEHGIQLGAVDVMIDGSKDHKLRERINRDAYEGMRVYFEPKADTNHQAVAAASIMAKTQRNDLMNELHKTYPEYGFRKNSGYGTEDHAEALVCHGRIPHVHRPLVEKHPHTFERKD